MNQCSSCGGFCKKSGCERANATICKHFRMGLVSGFGLACPYCHIEELESQMQGFSNEINDFKYTIERQTTSISTMYKALKEIALVHPYDTSSMFYVVAKAKDAIQKATGEVV